MKAKTLKLNFGFFMSFCNWNLAVELFLRPLCVELENFIGILLLLYFEFELFVWLLCIALSAEDRAGLVNALKVRFFCHVVIFSIARKICGCCFLWFL